MSRIGTQTIQIPEGVDIIQDGLKLTVKGPKGELVKTFSNNLVITHEGDSIKVTRKNDSKISKSLHGLTRSLVVNMLEGVTKGYSKQLEINGVGFKAAVNGQEITLNLGFSHDINYMIPDSITASVEQNIITISGIDKQLVGQAAAEIRALRKPEPYKGKGINYVGEYIIRKAGKAAATGKE
jgi:large subunit ribosomal protein L6